MNGVALHLSMTGAYATGGTSWNDAIGPGDAASLGVIAQHATVPSVRIPQAWSLPVETDDHVPSGLGAATPRGSLAAHGAPARQSFGRCGSRRRGSGSR
jgi:hypothetical protein